jgi:hypothetical protein
MSGFREEMSQRDKHLKNSFSTPADFPFQYSRHNDTNTIEQNAWINYVAHYGKKLSVRADLTFKSSRKVYLPSIGRNAPFSQILKITESDALLNISAFCDRMNYSAYKHAYKRYGKRLDVLSNIEGGRWELRQQRKYASHSRQEDKEIHCHLLIEKPTHISFGNFKLLIIKNWEDTDWGNYQKSITPIRSLEKCVSYNVKTSIESLDLENINLTTEVMCV